MLNPIFLTTACLVSVVALLFADHHRSTLGRILFKLAASTCFVLVAVSLGAHRSIYGQLILAALLLGWIGDALLLSQAPMAFLGGLGAFLLSHLCFAAAFWSAGTSASALGVAAVVTAVFGAIVLRWLLPHTPREFKVPVLAYVVVILAMCITAAGHAFAAQHGMVLAGALLFAASDIAVARERFVRQGFVNQLWGWPTYFVAQLVLAWTVGVTASLAQ